MAINHLNQTINTKEILHNYNVPDKISNAIASASRRTGVDFTYLIEKAAAESSFRPDIKAKTSSASGLYQFIESTWLQTVKKHGAKHGLQHMADAIKVTNGRYTVNNLQMREKILDERNNPRTAALMAAEFASDNKNRLANSLGRSDLGNTDLYLAHFLGAGGASRFLKAKAENGAQPAAALMPAAAKANRNVFYEKSGKARSIDEVYAFFAKKFDDTKPANILSKTVLAENDSQKLSEPSDLDRYVAQNTPGRMASIFQKERPSDQASWDGLLSRIRNVTKQDDLFNSAMMGGGLLAPETTMYMAAMNISEPSKEESGASLWLEKDKNKKENTSYQQKIASYDGF